MRAPVTRLHPSSWMRPKYPQPPRQPLSISAVRLTAPDGHRAPTLRGLYNRPLVGLHVQGHGAACPYPGTQSPFLAVAGAIRLPSEVCSTVITKPLACFRLKSLPFPL